MVIDGKGMLGHLQELEIEIGRLVAYAVGTLYGWYKRRQQSVILYMGVKRK